MSILQRELSPYGVAETVMLRITQEIEQKQDPINEYRCEYIEDGVIKYENISAIDYTQAWIRFKQKHPEIEPRTILDIV